MFFIMTLFIARGLFVSLYTHTRTHTNLVPPLFPPARRTCDASPTGNRLLSTEEQVTLITESMTVTSGDQEKLLLLNKNTELRRVNKEVTGGRRPRRDVFVFAADVSGCIPSQYNRGPWASCEKSPRQPSRENPR